MTKAIVSLSGGMDSATVLAEAMVSGRTVSCVGFTYGSKHNQYENRAALDLVRHYQVPFQLIDLGFIGREFKSDLLKSGGEIPEGHYEDESMSRTVVPGRNIIFSSILAGLAWSKGCCEIWLGVHRGDHPIYPDCRDEFIRVMDKAVRLGTDENVCIVTPFLLDTKARIVQRGLELDVPYRLTRTCYKDQPIACGKCGSCRERLEAFEFNGVRDPIEYEE